MEILKNIRSIKVNSYSARSEIATAKHKVDQSTSNSIDESSLLSFDPNEKLKLDEQGCIILNSNLTSPRAIIEIPTKDYVDCLSENNRNRRDIPTVINDQDNEFDNNKLTNLDGITVNRNPTVDNKLANKKIMN